MLHFGTSFCITPMYLCTLHEIYKLWFDLLIDWTWQLVLGGLWLWQSAKLLDYDRSRKEPCFCFSCKDYTVTAHQFNKTCNFIHFFCQRCMISAIWIATAVSCCHKNEWMTMRVSRAVRARICNHSAGYAQPFRQRSTLRLEHGRH